MRLSPNFTLEEATLSQTATRLHIDNQPDAETLANMEQAAEGMELVRSLLGYSIHVNSWLRVLRLNRAIGSKDTSDHVRGWAIDFTCPQFGTPLEICRAIVASEIEFSQLIFEGTWVHISFNPAKIDNREVLTARFDAMGRASYTRGLP